MKIGFFGGTFNPIHYGHLKNALLAKEQLKLNKVIFIPDKLPVHKSMEDLLSAENRYCMLLKAVSKIEDFEVSRIEIDREEPSYTIITIQTLSEIYPQCELFMIIGADSFNEIDTWKDYTRIIESVTVVVLKRKTDPILRADMTDMVGIISKLEIIDNDYIDISSTELREKLKQNKSVYDMIPDTVIEYIIEKRLYLS
jgi:nicotinate-nucleotide adenylyltransferase